MSKTSQNSTLVTIPSEFSNSTESNVGRLAAVRLTVPGRIISKSNNYRISGNRLYKTAACKDFEDRIRIAARAAYDSSPLTEDVELSLVLYHSDKRRRDIDNALKSILDALSGVVYVDDCQVTKLTVSKYIDTANPRLELAVFVST